MAEANPDSIVEEVSTLPTICPKCGHHGYSVGIMANEPIHWKCTREGCGLKLRIASRLATGTMERFAAAYSAGPTSRLGLRSEHQRNVDEFMRRANQDVPERPCIPPESVRKLRAKLILEEAFETVYALGFKTLNSIDEGGNVGHFYINPKVFTFIPHEEGPSLVGIIDGCGDTKVVTTGTLSACGVPDLEAQSRIDETNLAKFTGPKCDTCGGVMELMGTGDGTQQWVCVATNYGAEEVTPAKPHPFKPKEAGPYRRDDGKWIKPPDWTAPKFGDIIDSQLGHAVIRNGPPCPECGYMLQAEHRHARHLYVCPNESPTHLPQGLPIPEGTELKREC